MSQVERRKAEAQAWFERLRDRICAALEVLEDEVRQNPAARPAGRFERKPWERAGGGGGVMGVLGEGRVFEKAGVNVSTVWGEFSPAFAKEIPGAAESPQFWASGLSLVIHPRNPHVPPVHMNTRHIVTGKSWFGGGIDLNPIVADERDTAWFHAKLKAVCDAHPVADHARYKAWCDEYFFNKHRQEPRGIGGIFYDYLEGADEAEREAGFAFTRAVGEAFIDIYPALVRRHMEEPWGEAERRHQLFRRGRYAEFNLVYDRGTRFGLQTGGNPEAILMSLPPLAAWP